MLKKTNEIAYILGMTLCPLGVAFSARSGLGVSMVVAPAYVIHCKLSEILPWVTFGIAEYIFQGLLILLLALVLKKFKLKYLLSVFAIVYYGFLLDIWQKLVGIEVVPTIALKIIYGIIGLLITTFAIALVLHSYLPKQAYEVVVQDVTEKYNLKMNTVKLIFDISSLVLAIIMMLIFFKKFSFNMIGPGTLIMAFINAPLIAMFSKILEKITDFSSAFPKFRSKYLKLFD